MNRFLYNTGLINETRLEKLLIRRMRRETPLLIFNEPREKPSISTAVGGEMPKEREQDVSGSPALSRIRPETRISGVVVRLHLTSRNDSLQT